jgi:hypothetical protein
MIKRIFVLLVGIAFVFSLCACRKTAEEKLAEKMIEKNLKAAGLEGEVEVGDDGKSISVNAGEGSNVNIGGDQDWPSYVPKEIPVFKKGKVFAAAQMGENISVTLSYDNEDYLKDYIKEFEKAGWEKTYSHIDKEFGETTIVLDNGNYQVSIVSMTGDVDINIVKSQETSSIEEQDDSLTSSDEDNANNDNKSNTEYFGLNLNIDEAFDIPSGLPDFEAGLEIEVDMDQFSGADWAKGFNGVSEEDIAEFLIRCQDRGYKISALDDDPTSGWFLVSHSKKEKVLSVIYDVDFERVIMAYGTKYD